MNEPEMEALLEKEVCCGKKMKVVEAGRMSPYQETGGMALCLVCGSFVRITGGQLDVEEVEVYKEMEMNDADLLAKASGGKQ